MKTSINALTILLTAILIFHIDFAFAANDGSSISPKKSFSVNLMPVTPSEATFEDPAEMNINNSYDVLVPVTPTEATFEEADVVDLAPVTPAEADFEDL